MESQIEKNISGYKLIIQIEVGLREFIIASFNSSFSGIKWFSTEYNFIHRKKIEDADSMRKQSVEKGWDPQSAESIHGLYFLLLTDLKEILLKKYKLENEVLNVFQLNRNQLESICSGLQSIFPIRNKVAHSVYISDNEIHVLDSFLTTLSSMISDFDFLIKQPEIRRENENRVNEIIKLACEKMLRLEPLDEDELNDLNHRIEFVNSNSRNIVLDLINQYVKLSKMNGSFVRLKNLIEDNTLEIIKILNDE